MLRQRPPWGLLPWLLLLFAGCQGELPEPTSCDGIAEKTFGITRGDYSACAAEILDALDVLKRPLGKLVRGKESAKPEAEAAFRKLLHLMKQVGFQEDVWREAAGGTGRTVERWPDSGMVMFNYGVTGAAAYYMSALRYPNDDNYSEGMRLHDQARSAYARFR